MRKVLQHGLVMGILIACAPVAPSAGTGEKVKLKASSDKVVGHKVIISYEVPQDTLDKADHWIAVLPVNAPDTIYLQGAGVTAAKGEEIVYLGEMGKPEHAGKYQIRLVSFKSDQVKEAGGIKIGTAKKLGMKTIASIIVERVE